jgi:hypothetical protein
MKRFRVFNISLALLFASAMYAQAQPVEAGDVAMPDQGTELTVLSPGDLAGPMGTTSCKSGNAGAIGNCETIEATTLPGVDIGAKINAAYMALPSTGGVITIAPVVGCYDFSTPINLNTSGKYVVLRGLAPSNQNGSGACLNYQPTTATRALTIDWTPSSGGGWIPGAGLRDITLVNNDCVTAGGCKSAATGIAIGPLNGGAEFGYFENVSISGFGVAVANLIPSGLGSVSFGMTWINSSVRFNTVGWSIVVDAFVENLHFVGGTISQNGIGFQDAAGSEIDFGGTSFDSNTIAGFSCSGGGDFTFISPHFENYGGTTTHYVSCSKDAGNITLHGGLALDDVSSGNADYWFAAPSISVDGLTVFSAGRRVSKLFTVKQQSNIKVRVNSPAILPISSIGILQSKNGIYEITSVNSTLLKPTIGSQIYDMDETTTPSVLTGKDRCYGDLLTHSMKCSYNGTNFQQVPLSSQGTCSVGTNCVIKFATPFSLIPVCVATDQTAPNPVKAAPSKSGVTFKGTNADVLAWVCIGDPD